MVKNPVICFFQIASLKREAFLDKHPVYNILLTFDFDMCTFLGLGGLWHSSKSEAWSMGHTEKS